MNTHAAAGPAARATIKVAVDALVVVRRSDRRALAGRVRRGSRAGRGQPAGARRRRAHARRDDVRAAIGVRRAQGRRRARRAQHRATSCETYARDKPRDWAPLVYCWRGGQRSRALVHVLNEIGFRAVQLDGGYRAYRRHVVLMLAQLPAAFRFRVICGLTGSGKSRLIEAVAAEGGQVLDLERLARHRGSLLGDVPGDPQPTQKRFESALFAALVGTRCRRSRCSSNRKASGSASCRCPKRCSRRCALRPACASKRPGRCASRCCKGDYAHLAPTGISLHGAAGAARQAARQGDHRALGRMGAGGATTELDRRPARRALRSLVRARDRAQLPAPSQRRGRCASTMRRTRRSSDWRGSCSIARPREFIRHHAEAIDARLDLPHRQRIRRTPARRQSARRVRGRARAGRRDDAGARAAVQPVGNDVRAAVDSRDGARADLHADVRDAVRRASDARHRARRARAAARPATA